ncbi:hypothetical protein GF345_01065 [Candidatus Woesearchaeota archaeon]|nr:hypothetical protein [Candidatus Woesearchaeota archaeon]
MAFTDKLKFWKKDEPLEPIEPPGGFDSQGIENDPFGKSSGFGSEEPSGFGKQDNTESKPWESRQPAQSDVSESPEKNQDISLKGPSYEKPPDSGDLRHAPLSPMEQRQPYQGSGGVQAPSRDIEILSAKVDAIKANVESINHRLESIERMLMTQEKKRNYQW